MTKDFNSNKIIKRYEVEEALAKLLYYIYVSINYSEYKEWKSDFQAMLDIVKIWINYYIEKNNLLEITDEEVTKIKKHFDNIPFEAYNGDYFEEIETWLDVVIYYGSCPIGEKFDETKIIKKGKR